jgi:hypothetical protein
MVQPVHYCAVRRPSILHDSLKVHLLSAPVFNYRELTRGMHLVLPTEMSLCRLAVPAHDMAHFIKGKSQRKRDKELVTTIYQEGEQMIRYVQFQSINIKTYTIFNFVKPGLSNYETI